MPLLVDASSEVKQSLVSLEALSTSNILHCIALRAKNDSCCGQSNKKRADGFWPLRFAGLTGKCLLAVSCRCRLLLARGCHAVVL